MPRTAQQILDSADELAARFEQHEPGDNVRPAALRAGTGAAEPPVVQLQVSRTSTAHVIVGADARRASALSRGQFNVSASAT